MKSYLRFLSRNRLYTAIMAVGLSVALAFVTIMSCFVWQNLRVYRYYPDQDKMFAIGMVGNVMSNMVMTQTMMDAIPEIEDGTTIKVLRMNPASSIEGTEINSDFFMGIYQDFFRLFPTEFIYGNIEAFNDLNNVMVTKSLAERFGGKDIIGKRLLFEGKQEFTVAAVVEDFNETIFENVQVILNLDCSSFNHSFGYNLHGASSGTISIIKTKDGTDEKELLDKMEDIYKIDIGSQYHRDKNLSLTRLDKIYTSDNNEGGYTGFKKGNEGLMTAFSIIVIFLLISAIFNYINLCSALAGRRSKEIATRMLLGESREDVFKRNLLESLTFIATCMCIALITANLCLPYINNLLDSPIPVKMELSHGYIYIYILIMGITVFFGSIASGLVPFHFKPIEVIKGNHRHHKQRTFNKLFIIIQNIIAIIIVAVTLTMNAQIKHMIEMPLNADTEDIYICELLDRDFEKTLREFPFIEEFGRASGRPGQRSANYGFCINDDVNNPVSFDVCECDSTSFRLFGFKIVKDYGTPGGQGAWLTESAVRKFEIDPDNPVFPQKNAWAINYEEIAGIIEDVQLNSALDLNPESVAAVIVCSQDPDWSDYVIKLSDPSASNIQELYRSWDKARIAKHGENSTIDAGYFPELIEKKYEGIRKQARMVTLFMIVAIMLSALGQIAMSTYYATEKEKEIGVRKVFGGTVRSESIRNIFEYMVYCMIASAVAIPLSIWIGNRYLETFVYKMAMQPWIFIAAALTAFAVSLASVLWQTLRAARTNPADALKKE